MPINHEALRRNYESACRDKTPERFHGDLRQALAKREFVPEDFSIRQLFEQFVPNGRELVNSWAPGQGNGGVSLLEAGDAVMSSAFSNISGAVVFSKILQGYEDEEFIFTNLIPTIQTQFNGERMAGIGRIGDKAEIVGEAEPYPYVGVGEDWVSTPPTVKRGNIVPVTREAIFFDRTGLLLQRCSEVGHFLGVNKEKRAIDCVIDENVTTHRYRWRDVVYATYQTTTPWDNVTASATLADYTDVDEAEQTLSAIVDPYTGEPISGGSAKHLIVCRQTVATAMRILNSLQINSGDVTAGAGIQMATRNMVKSYTLVSSLLLAGRMATDTTWYLGDIGRAFVYMQNWPIQVKQAPANNEKEFERDIVQQYRADERGAFATLEPRLMSKNTVA